MKWLYKIFYLVIFIGSMVLVLFGQRNIGAMGLILMLCGLVGLLSLMYIYNKKYQ